MKYPEKYKDASVDVKLAYIDGKLDATMEILKKLNGNLSKRI